MRQWPGYGPPQLPSEGGCGPPPLDQSGPWAATGRQPTGPQITVTAPQHNAQAFTAPHTLGAAPQALWSATGRQPIGAQMTAAAAAAHQVGATFSPQQQQAHPQQQGYAQMYKHVAHQRKSGYFTLTAVRFNGSLQPSSRKRKESVLNFPPDYSLQWKMDRQDQVSVAVVKGEIANRILHLKTSPQAFGLYGKASPFATADEIFTSLKLWASDGNAPISDLEQFLPIHSGSNKIYYELIDKYEGTRYAYSGSAPKKARGAAFERTVQDVSWQEEVELRRIEDGGQYTHPYYDEPAWKAHPSLPTAPLGRGGMAAMHPSGWGEPPPYHPPCRPPISPPPGYDIFPYPQNVGDLPIDAVILGSRTAGGHLPTHYLLKKSTEEGAGAQMRPPAATMPVASMTSPNAARHVQSEMCPITSQEDLKDFFGSLPEDRETSVYLVISDMRTLASVTATGEDIQVLTKTTMQQGTTPQFMVQGIEENSYAVLYTPSWIAAGGADEERQLWGAGSAAEAVMDVLASSQTSCLPGEARASKASRGDRKADYVITFTAMPRSRRACSPTTIQGEE